MRRKMFGKVIICQFACLGKTVHALVDTTINMAVMDSVLEVVEGDDAVRGDRDWDADEFGFKEIGVEVEIAELDGHESAIGGANDAVEEKFGGGEIGCLCCFVARVVDSVATKSPADASRLWFLRAIGSDDADVSGIFVAREIFEVDEF